MPRLPFQLNSSSPSLVPIPLCIQSNHKILQFTVRHADLFSRQDYHGFLKVFTFFANECLVALKLFVSRNNWKPDIYYGCHYRLRCRNFLYRLIYFSSSFWFYLDSLQNFAIFILKTVADSVLDLLSCQHV